MSMRCHVSFLAVVLDEVDCDTIQTRTVRRLIMDDDGLAPRLYPIEIAEQIVSGFTAAGIRGARLDFPDDTWTDDDGDDSQRIQQEAGAWRCLVSSPRFMSMTVAEAIAELRNNGCI